MYARNRNYSVHREATQNFVENREIETKNRKNREKSFEIKTK